MTKLMLISVTAVMLFINGPALALDRLSLLGGLNSLKPMQLRYKYLPFYAPDIHAMNKYWNLSPGQEVVGTIHA